MHSSVACERRFCTRRVYTYLATTATHIVCDVHVYSAVCPDTCVHVTPSTADIQILHWRQHFHWILTYSPTPISKFRKHLHINILKIWQTEDAKLTSHFLNTFTAIVDLSRFNNSCLKSPASTLVYLTFQSRALRSFSLNELRNLSL